MITHPRFNFYHIPKTGGMWVTDVLLKANITACKTSTGTNRGLSLFKEHGWPERRNKIFSFTFVRDPETWYRSYWAYREYDKWGNRQNIIDTELASHDFNQFVNNCIDRFPHGLATEIFKRFTGPKAGKMQFVGKYERLEKDLKKALDMAGVEIREELYKTGKINVSDGELKAQAIYDRKTKRRMKDAEKWVYNTFYN